MTGEVIELLLKAAVPLTILASLSGVVASYISARSASRRIKESERIELTLLEHRRNQKLKERPRQEAAV